MKYYRKRKGAPPSVIVGGKNLGTVPLPIEHLKKEDRVKVERLLKNGWI